MTNATSTTRPIYVIADDIRKHWNPMNYAAAPYWDAMRALDSISDTFLMDDARSIVLYFLSNAQTWRGPEARRIKAELKELLKASPEPKVYPINPANWL